MILFKKIILFLIVVAIQSQAVARVNVLSYDSSIVINKTAVEAASLAAVDSIVRLQPALQPGAYVAREHVHFFYDNTFDFYLVLGLVLGFGLMRFAHPRYFQYLLRAFRSPSFGTQQQFY